jgi:hypothetical protein
VISERRSAKAKPPHPKNFNSLYFTLRGFALQSGNQKRQPEAATRSGKKLNFCPGAKNSGLRAEE